MLDKQEKHAHLAFEACQNTLSDKIPKRCCSTRSHDDTFGQR